jgi:Asp-tRNA(Asn)/Glu-tRNA(Gln) amidotransferase A subunit family amidase
VPEWTVDVSSYGVESAVFFDELIRTGRDKQLTNPGRGNGFRTSRTIPAVEYLQSQRARMMMMMKLAEATADVDVYLAPFSAGGGGGGARGGAIPTDGARGGTAPGDGGARGGTVSGDGAAPVDGVTPIGARGGRGRGRGGGTGGGFNAQRRSAVQRHFNMANLACYPALSVPNGFSDAGTPGSITFYARPFGEAELLAVAKAYQEASGFHLKHPKLEA